MTKQTKLDLKSGAAGGSEVECLGLKFPSEQARRDHFLARLKERLADPEFRKTRGFPKATDEDILRLSDPPWYTACPNPFLSEFVASYGRAYDANEEYHREPFAIDVSVGKTDRLFQLHSYHTKVPYLAIAPSILHYTKPGDVVLDAFAGSGMTGVAAQYCGTAPTAYRNQLEHEWRATGHEAPMWGSRRAVLGDLGPAATLIAAGYNIPFDVDAFAEATRRILSEVEAELGWMYQTASERGATGRIDFTVWSEVFSCPDCAGELVFAAEALDPDDMRIRKTFPCPNCNAQLSRTQLERLITTSTDPVLRQPHRVPKRVPFKISYTCDKKVMEKAPDADDLATLERVAALPLPPEIPVGEIPYMHMTHERARLDTAGVTHSHHFFTPRAAQSLAAMWRHATLESDVRLRHQLLFLFEQGIWTMALLNRYQPGGYKQVNKFLNGVYYVPAQHCEVSPWYALGARAKRIEAAMREFAPPPASVAITTGDCARQPLADSTIDYIFTDPPFGENIYYADLNFLVESWHRVLTDAAPEAIVDQAKHKGVHEYQDLTKRCFAEYFRVLKPGRWMTVVFSNSSNAVWRAIQEAIGTAGFVIADVRTLDKKQGSYRQVTSTAVKQDLIISAYKPTDALASRFQLGSSTTEGAWAFVAEHLANVPLFVPSGEAAETVVERTGQMLLDRMIAFHVQRGLAVPIDASDFLEGLRPRFQERDGMYFLPDQIGEYDKRRTTVKELRQLSLFVHDEASSIQWLRQQLQDHPQSYQELHPQFLKAVQDDAWEKHEVMIDLKQVLEQSFLCYDGDGPVPSQIHSYLSSNYKSLRNKGKEDPALVAEATDRWYVPDAAKQADREKQRKKALLKEFEEYRLPSARKLKQFRTEAVRAGFKAAWDAGDYATIVRVGERLPEDVLQEDEKLLMYYDVARSRMGDD